MRQVLRNNAKANPFVQIITSYILCWLLINCLHDTGIVWPKDEAPFLSHYSSPHLCMILGKVLKLLHCSGIGQVFVHWNSPKWLPSSWHTCKQDFFCFRHCYIVIEKFQKTSQIFVLLLFVIEIMWLLKLFHWDSVWETTKLGILEFIYSMFIFLNLAK